MLALAIALLFTLTGILAVLAIADSVLKARRAYGRLMQEAALMQAEFVEQAAPQDMRVRRVAAKPSPVRRSSAPLPLLAVPAYAAA